MNLVFWDAMLFIYQFEGHPELARRVAYIAERMLVRGDQLCTSALVAGEVMAGPAKAGDASILQRYEEFFASPGLRVLPFQTSTAARFARIRAAHRVSPPDAVNLACAAEAGVDLFVTHDTRLAGKYVPGIRFVADLAADVW